VEVEDDQDLNELVNEMESQKIKIGPAAPFHGLWMLK